MSIDRIRARTAHTLFRRLTDSLSARSVRTLVAGLTLTSSIAGIAHAQQNSLQVPAYNAQQQHQQPIQVQRPGMYAGEQLPPVQQVQLTLDPRRPLDNRIEAMPKAEEKLEVINHRSQLIVTRSPIRRIAWSDTQLLDVVQFSPTEISLIGQGLGSTDLWLWFEGQEQPLMYVVTVVRDPDLDQQRNLNYGRIERKLSLLYPNSKVYLIPVSRKIIVRGQARDAEEAANIMNLIRGEVIAQEGYLNGGDVGNGLYGGGNGGGGFGNNGLGGVQGGLNGGGFGNDFNSWYIVDELRLPGEFQIMINVRTAEIQRSQLRRLGVDWRAAINGTGAILTSTMAGGAPNLTGVFDSGNLIIAVDLLASHGVAKILDDARLVTLSGEPAAFLSGGEFAVPTIVGVGGAQGQQTSFRGYGTSIICTPTLLDNDLIRLEIVPEVSQLNSGNSVGGIPGVNVRRVQTRVELREGQSISLGGVFSRREAAEVTRVPFLGEIPVVGTWLFNAKKATEDESEMLIIVTPEIVRPMDSDQVPPLPGWYSTHPNDHDFFKYNRIEGNADLGNYELLPYGNGQPYGQDVGYNYFNPNTATPQIAPGATGGAQGPYPNGVYAPAGQQFGPPPGGQYAPQYGPAGPQPGQPVPPQGGQQQLMEPVPMPGASRQSPQRSGQVQQTSAQRPQQRSTTR